MSGVEFLLDTNIVIGLLKGYEPAVSVAEASRMELGRAAISQITRMELLSFNSLSEQEESEIRAFISCCQVLMLDEVIEARAIQLRRSGALKLPAAIVASTQKRQRAFAAAFLCPIDSLIEFLDDDFSETALEAAAQHFEVSERIVTYQLANNGYSFDQAASSPPYRLQA